MASRIRPAPGLWQQRFPPSKHRKQETQASGQSRGRKNSVTSASGRRLSTSWAMCQVQPRRSVP